MEDVIGNIFISFLERQSASNGARLGVVKRIKVPNFVISTKNFMSVAPCERKEMEGRERGSYLCRAAMMKKHTTHVQYTNIAI